MGPDRVPASWDQRETNLAQIRLLPALPVHSTFSSLPGEESQQPSNWPELWRRDSLTPTPLKGHTSQESWQWPLPHTTYRPLRGALCFRRARRGGIGGSLRSTLPKTRAGWLGRQLVAPAGLGESAAEACQRPSTQEQEQV